MRNRHRSIQRVVAGAIALAAISLFAATAAAQGDKVMLIIDSSRSMWGHIDGVNKVVHARKALEGFFKQQKESFRLGVMAYGHQQKASCEDFEVLKNIGSIDPGAYASAVNNIAPKGSTPIAAALDAAVDTMARESGRKHIVLLSDGLDNCKGDPCALASRLGKSAPDMTLHAIAFDKGSKKEKLEQLACLAEPSGGVFKFADNREALDSALSAVASRITAPPRPEQTAALPENVDPNAPVPIKLTAYLSGADGRVKRDIIWRIFAGRAGDDGRYKMLKEVRKVEPTLELQPGSYFVNASWGMAQTTKRLNITPGQPAHEQIILKAGAIKLKARQSNGASLDMDDARFEIFTDKTDQFGNRERIIADAPAGPGIRLNAGTYFVVSRYGDSNAVVEAKVDVKPGKLSEVNLIHDASKVTFRLAERRGGEAIADTRWTISTEDGQVVKRTAGAFPTHILSAGRYRVRAQHDDQSYTRQFELAGSGTRKIEVLMR